MTGFGVDTIAVRGPVHPDSAAAFPTQRFRRTLDPVTGECLDELTSARGWSESPRWLCISTRTGQTEAYIEFSVPRQVRGDNRRPALCQETVTAVRDAYTDAADLVDWLCPVEDLKVARIDLARDFRQVEHAPLLLAGLESVPARRMTTFAYRRGHGLGVQTLERRTTRQVGKLYVRADAYRSKAAMAESGSSERDRLRELAESAHGVVRFELQLRTAGARQHDIHRLADLKALVLADVARHWFERRCRFGAEVGDGHNRMRQAVESAMAGGEGGRVVTALGQLLADAIGVDGGRNPRTMADYRRTYQRWGLRPGDVVGHEAELRRLDFASGLVVRGTPTTDPTLRAVA